MALITQGPNLIVTDENGNEQKRFSDLFDARMYVLKNGNIDWIILAAKKIAV